MLSSWKPLGFGGQAWVGSLAPPPPSHSASWTKSLFTFKNVWNLFTSLQSFNLDKFSVFSFSSLSPQVRISMSLIIFSPILVWTSSSLSTFSWSLDAPNWRRFKCQILTDWDDSTGPLFLYQFSRCLGGLVAGAVFDSGNIVGSRNRCGPWRWCRPCSWRNRPEKIVHVHFKCTAFVCVCVKEKPRYLGSVTGFLVPPGAPVSVQSGDASLGLTMCVVLLQVSFRCSRRTRHGPCPPSNTKGWLVRVMPPKCPSILLYAV